MSDELTTTAVSTTTMTSTTTLTRTLVGLVSLTPASTGNSSVTDKNQIDGESLYPYNSSFSLSVLFTILFFIATLYHGYLSLYRPTHLETINKHRYTIPLFIASLFSTVGYLTRSISIQPANDSNLSLYAASTALILVAPIFICATLYLQLARLIKRCLPSPPTTTPTTTTQPTRNRSPSRANPQKFLLLPPTHLSMFFLTSDALSFLTQILGAARAASNSFREPEASQGTRITLTGLVIQLTTFALYALTLHLFCARVRDSPMTGFNPCVAKVVGAAWVAAGFVLLRNVFRLVEFAAGPNGYAFTHEWCLYVFEAVPVWAALVVLAWCHPVTWIQERVLAAHVEDPAPRHALKALGVVGAFGRGRPDISDRLAGPKAAEDRLLLRMPRGGSVRGDQDIQCQQQQGHVKRRSKVDFAS